RPSRCARSRGADRTGQRVPVEAGSVREDRARLVARSAPRQGLPGPDHLLDSISRGDPADETSQERTMASPRVRKIADRIKVIVAEMLERRIKDPRLGFVTVT